MRKTRAVGGGEERGPTVVGRGWEGRGLAPSRMESAAEEVDIVARATTIDGDDREDDGIELGKNLFFPATSPVTVAATAAAVARTRWLLRVARNGEETGEGREAEAATNGAVARIAAVRISFSEEGNMKN